MTVGEVEEESKNLTSPGIASPSKEDNPLSLSTYLTSKGQTIYPSNLSSPSSTWRSSLNNKYNSQSNQYHDSQKKSGSETCLKWTTDSVELLVNDSNSYLLTSRAVKSDNLILNVIPGELNDESLTQYSIKGHGDPIFKMASCNSYVALGGSGGQVSIYKMSLENLMQHTETDISPISRITVGDADLNNIRISPPGTRIASSRIACLDFAYSPSGTEFQNRVPGKLLVSQGRQLFIYDSSTGKLSAGSQIGKDSLTAAKWSPHDEYGSLVGCGSVDSDLSIIDVRKMNSISNRNGVAWKVNHAHRGRITCLSFNPFIPYWMASGGADGVVKLWDIRHARIPVSQYHQHYKPIESLTWSNARVNMLASCSVDGQFKVMAVSSGKRTPLFPRELDMCIGCPGSEYSTSHEVECIGCEELYSFMSPEPLISLVSSSATVDIFHTVSQCGQVSTHKVDGKIFLDAIMSNTDTDIHNPESSTDRLLVLRDMRAVYENIISFSQSDQLNLAMERKLIDVSTSPLPICADSWTLANESGSLVSPFTPIINLSPASMGSPKVTQMMEQHAWIRAAVEQAAHDLDRFGKNLPPAFDHQPWRQKVPEHLKEQLEALQLRTIVMEKIEAKDIDSVISLEKSLLRRIDSAPKLITPTILSRILQAVMIFDYPKGFHLGCQFLEVISDHHKSTSKTPRKDLEQLLPLFRHVFFPTIYDQEAWYPTDAATNMSVLSVDTRKKAYIMFITAREKAMERSRASVNGGARRRSSLLTQKTVMGSTSELAIPAVHGSIDAFAIQQASKDESIITQLLSVPSWVTLVQLEARLMKAAIKGFNAHNVIKIFYETSISGTSRAAAFDEKNSIPTDFMFMRSVSGLSNLALMEALVASNEWVAYFRTAVSYLDQSQFTQLVSSHIQSFAKPHFEQFIHNGMIASSTFMDKCMELKVAGTATSSEIAGRLRTCAKTFQPILTLILQCCAPLANGLDMPFTVSAEVLPLVLSSGRALFNELLKAVIYPFFDLTSKTFPSASSIFVETAQQLLTECKTLVKLYPSMVVNKKKNTNWSSVKVLMDDINIFQNKVQSMLAITNATNEP